MTANHDDLLPLEQWLKEKQGLKDKFPARSDQYFIRYLNIKKYLVNKIYKHIGAATSAEDGGIYTDHGPDHFNAVINYAGKLLGVDESSGMVIEPYEVYLLLTSILLHDAGNVEGRTDHATKPYVIMNKMGELAWDDRTEARIVSDIAEVHGGKTKKGDEDTIGNMNWDDTKKFLSIDYRPNMIAALVRFADEICEDRTRSVKYLIEVDKLPKQSEAFQYYAYFINSVSVDRRDKSIQIEYQIEKKYLCRKFGKLSEEVYIVDEIMLRLEKMNNERIYCSRFMYEIIPLRQIKASITVIDEDYCDLEIKKIQLIDSGYPAHTLSLAELYPDWIGEKLEKKYKDGTEH